MTFQAADVEDLPFEDGSFDVVLSTFGAMFTPDRRRPAGEMLGVLRGGGRIGGRIGLLNWTPKGFIGWLSKPIGAHASLPVGLPSHAASSVVPGECLEIVIAKA